MRASEWLQRAVSASLGLAPLLIVFGCDKVLGVDFDAERRRVSDAGADVREDASSARDVDADASHDAQPTDGVAADSDASDGPAPDGTNEAGPEDGGDGAADGGLQQGDGGDEPFAPVAGVNFHHPTFHADDFVVRGFIRDMQANGVHFSIPWRTGFYTSNDSCALPGCPNQSCYGANCPDCQAGEVCYWRPASVDLCRMERYHELECWVRGALNFWTGPDDFPPVSVLATLLVHSGAIGDWRVGPRHIAELQMTPEHVTSERVLAAYRVFYDEIIRILKDVAYQGSVRDWTLSVGNHVNTYLCDAPEREAFREFYEHALAYAREPSRHPEQPLRLGTSATFHALECPGVWDITAEDESSAAPYLRALNTQSDVLLLEYFGAGAAGTLSVAALDPTQAERDVARMFAFRDAVRPGGRRLPLLLADVGYSTHPDLHDVDAAYGERFSRFGAAYASAETAQQLFAASLFNGLQGRRDFAGLYWWALSDLPDWEPSACRSYVMDEFGGNYPVLESIFCRSGLLTPPAFPARGAAGAFELWASIFTR